MLQNEEKASMIYIDARNGKIKHETSLYDAFEGVLKRVTVCSKPNTRNIMKPYYTFEFYSEKVGKTFSLHIEHNGVSISLLNYLIGLKDFTQPITIKPYISAESFCKVSVLQAGVKLGWTVNTTHTRDSVEQWEWYAEGVQIINKHLNTK